MSKTPKLLIDQRSQLFERAMISLAPVRQQLGYLVRI
jgi:hypothetical protein